MCLEIDMHPSIYFVFSHFSHNFSLISSLRIKFVFLFFFFFHVNFASLDVLLFLYPRIDPNPSANLSDRPLTGRASV